MKAQRKLPGAQLHLPLLDRVPIALPADQSQRLIQALIELLLSAAVPQTAKGESHEPQADR